VKLRLREFHKDVRCLRCACRPLDQEFRPVAEPFTEQTEASTGVSKGANPAVTPSSRLDLPSRQTSAYTAGTALAIYSLVGLPYISCYYIRKILNLLSHVFRSVIKNALAAGALLQTPLGELTALPMPPIAGLRMRNGGRKGGDK